MNTSFKTFLKGSVISLAGVGTVGILNYLVRRHLSLNLTERDYGIFYSSFSLVAMLFGFGELGISQSGTALLAESSRQPQRRNEFFSALLVFKTLIGVVCFLAILLVSNRLAHGYLAISAGYPLILLAAMMALQSYEGSFRCLWNGLKKFSTLSCFVVAHGALLLCGVFWGVPQYGLNGALYAFAGAMLVLALAETFYVRKKQNVKWSFSIPGHIWRELFSLSGWVAVSSTLLNTIYHLDTVMLTILKGVESSAMYNIALPIMQIVQSLMIFPVVFLPVAMQMSANKDHRGLLHFAKWGGVATCAGAILVYIIFQTGAEFLISLLFSRQYLAAAPAVPLLCSGLIFFTSGNFFFQILLCLKKTRAMVVIGILTMGCNVLLNWFLINRFDFVGAAGATLCSYVLFAAMSMGTVLFHLNRYLRS